MMTDSTFHNAQAELAWLKQLAGRFIVFDGPDGSGKTTQFRRFAQLVARSDLQMIEVREPGGTYIGEQIRKVLLDPDNQEEVDIRCEMLLFMASRAQLVQQKLRPAIKQGKLILADRFISSTLAYQGAAGGLSIDDIMAVGRFALNDVWPDLVVVFDVDEKTAAGRLNPLLDRIELKSAAFHRQVRQGYLDQAKANPKQYAVIDARAEPDVVHEQLLWTLRDRLG
jgi:dTMP kinase